MKIEKNEMTVLACAVAAVLLIAGAASAQVTTEGTNELPEGYHMVVFTLDPDNAKKIVVTPTRLEKVQKGDVVLFHNKSSVRIKVDFSDGDLGSPFPDATFKVKPETSAESTKTLSIRVDAPEDGTHEYSFEVSGPNGEEPAPDQSPVIRVGPKSTSGTRS
jgi:hypothetical protein